MAPQQGGGGSDEAFTSFAFVLVSMILFIMYIPSFIGFIRNLFSYFTKSSRRGEQTNPFLELFAPLKTFFGEVLYLVTSPFVVLSAVKVVLRHPRFLLPICIPRFVKFCFRPKVFLLILWCFLFSAALYTNLTFDAHAVLGVSTDASLAEIKKTYRKITKLVHPDHNKTDAARERYALVRKAYKALVDRETFEKEAFQEEFSVGVALPRFLTSRENDMLVVFGLLGSLLAIPLWLWWKYSGSPEEKAEKLIMNVRHLEVTLEKLYLRLGVNPERKYQIHKEEKLEVEKILKTLKLHHSTLAALNVYPTISELRKKLAERERNGVFFEKFQWTEHLDSLQKACDAVPVAAVGEETEPRVKFFHIGSSEFDAVFYLFKEVLSVSDASLDELQGIVKAGVLKPVSQLKKHHETVLQLLEWAHAEKCSTKDLTHLSEAPRIGFDLSNELLPALEQLKMKLYKEHLKQYQQQMKRR